MAGDEIANKGSRKAPEPASTGHLQRLTRAALADLELEGAPPGQQRGRVARRFLIALILLVAFDLALRARQGALDATFFQHYRMPNVSVPPLREFADAIARRRAADPGTLVVGAVGPSFIWGHGYPSAASIPARLAQKLDTGPGTFTSLNLAMLRNRYADDRMLAEFFGSVTDVILVPYSAYEAEALARGYCPSHLDVVEWSGRFPEPFPLPPGCKDRERHAVNAWLEGAASRAWFTYGHRAGLRQLVFSESGDFGATLYAGFTHAIRQEPARALPPGIGGAAPHLVARPPSAPAFEPDPPGLRAEVERLCRAYVAKGTTALFYYLPTVEDPAELDRDRGFVSGFERALAEVTRAEPRCRPLELHYDSPLTTDDYFDKVHPNAMGFDKVATALAAALVQQRAAGAIHRDPARP